MNQQIWMMVTQAPNIDFMLLYVSGNPKYFYCSKDPVYLNKQKKN